MAPRHHLHALQAISAVFTAEIVPDEGGDTGFADMRAAYDAVKIKFLDVGVEAFGFTFG
jgi:hypothetical protein